MQYLSNSRRELSNSRSHNYMDYRDPNKDIIMCSFAGDQLPDCGSRGGEAEGGSHSSPYQVSILESFQWEITPR